MPVQARQVYGVAHRLPRQDSRLTTEGPNRSPIDSLATAGPTGSVPFSTCQACPLCWPAVAASHARRSASPLRSCQSNRRCRSQRHPLPLGSAAGRRHAHWPVSVRHPYATARNIHAALAYAFGVGLGAPLCAACLLVCCNQRQPISAQILDRLHGACDGGELWPSLLPSHQFLHLAHRAWAGQRRGHCGRPRCARGSRTADRYRTRRHRPDPPASGADRQAEMEHALT